MDAAPCYTPLPRRSEPALSAAEWVASQRCPIRPGSNDIISIYAIALKASNPKTSKIAPTRYPDESELQPLAWERSSAGESSGRLGLALLLVIPKKCRF